MCKGYISINQAQEIQAFRGEGVLPIVSPNMSRTSLIFRKIPAIPGLRTKIREEVYAL